MLLVVQVASGVEVDLAEGMARRVSVSVASLVLTDLASTDRMPVRASFLALFSGAWTGCVVLIRRCRLSL